jgi:hypothetical protein
MPKIPLGKNDKDERKVHFFFMRVNVLMAEMKKKFVFLFSGARIAARNQITLRLKKELCSNNLTNALLVLSTLVFQRA